MYVVFWRFRTLRGRESEFERAYGPSGEWSRLFQRGEGYLGTEVFRRAEDPREYLALDLWRRLRRIPSSLHQRISIDRPSVGRAHRRGGAPGRFRGPPLEAQISRQVDVWPFHFCPTSPEWVEEVFFVE